ncbi:MAG: hypothetical protein ACPGID_09895 [Rubricella sp.]
MPFCRAGSLAALLALSACGLGETFGAYRLPADTPEPRGGFPALFDPETERAAPLTEEERAIVEAELEALRRAASGG